VFGQAGDCAVRAISVATIRRSHRNKATYVFILAFLKQFKCGNIRKFSNITTFEKSLQRFVGFQGSVDTPRAW
jgi:hypothetical protein